MKKLIQLLLPVILFAGCAPQQLPEVNYLQEKITYSSKNIIGFENLFGEALLTQEDLEIFGIMHFPDDYDASQKYPVIVASHGSLNWRAHHLDYLEQMRQANYIVFAMHPFDSRGVNSTVGNQINVTSESAIYDMATSLNLLWDDPRINNQ